MRHLLLAAAALIVAAPLAMAGNTPTPVAPSSTITFGFTGNQGSTTTNTIGTVVSGTSESGAQFSLGAMNGAKASFTSNGQASSITTISPTTVFTSSQHTAFATAATTNGANVNATSVATFADSTGTFAQNLNSTSYQNSTFGVSGTLPTTSLVEGFGG